MPENPEERPRRTSEVLRAIWVGALLGAVVPVAATAVHLYFTGADDWTASSALVAHRSRPLLWLVDVVPLAMAVTAGVYVRSRLRRADAEARERRVGFDALMRMAQEAVVVADERDRIVEWSPGAEDLLGHHSGDIVGAPLTSLIALRDIVTFEAEIARARRTRGHEGRIVLAGLTRDGGQRAIEVSLATWQTRSGQMLGAVLHDVSKQVLAERRLGEVEKNWRNIAMSSFDALLLVDRVGTVVFANRGPLDMPVDEVIGQNISELVPELADVFTRALAQVFESGEPYQHEARVTAKDGRAHWWWCRLAPQREDGEVACAVLSISEIGDRIERDLAVRRLAGIVERTRDAVFATDGEGRIRVWNSGAELLWGWGTEEILGLPMATLFPDDLLEEQAATFARLRDGRHVNPYDTFGVAKNRRRLPVSVSATATRDQAGSFEGISAVVRDTTHHLELQTALEQAKGVAETASQLKSEFLANMSHEVRTPLNGVVGMADLLRATALTAEQEGYVATLLEATRALRVVVDDVLDFSKIEAGRLELDRVEFDLLALLNNAVEMFRAAAQENDTALRLTLPAHGPLRVLGDPNRIRQVLINLVGNAVKFTKSGGVDVRLTLGDDGGPSVAVRVEVEDTGVGISREAQSLIFQPFAQGDGSITRRFGGTGLGLSICRKLMELMNGKIGFTSAVGAGSLFWFELTLDKAKSSGARRRTAHPAAASKSQVGWRILVAEDNSINQKVVSAMLRGLGYHADMANNGREALESWQRGGYDLILMDCQMPVMSGYEATEAIRKREQGGDARIPILAMTAQAYAQDRARCMQAGMDGHLAKPVTASELGSALSQWLPLEGPVAGAVSLPSPVVLVESPSVDTSKLERLEADLGEGGREMLVELIETFITDCEQTLVRLEASAKAAAWSQVALDAHRLRSGTSNLAAFELTRLCHAIEERARGTEPARAEELILRLQGEFPRARAALVAHIRRESSPRLRGPGDPTLATTPEANSVSS